MTLAATTVEDARGNPQLGTKDFINWPTEEMCNGAPLLAVAYREDQLPDHIVPPVDLAKASPKPQYKQLISNITRDCQTADDTATEDYLLDSSYSYVLDVDNSGDAGRRQLSAEDATSTWESYLALDSQMEDLIAAAKPGMKQMTAWGADTSQEFMSEAYGDQVYNARPQFAQSAANLQKALEAPQSAANAQQRQAAIYDYACNVFSAELGNSVLNITLGPKQGLKECAEEGSRVFVFVYNCLKPDEITHGGKTTVTNPELMVSVKLDILQTSAQSECFNSMDRFVLYLNWTTVIIAGVVALFFTVLFEVGPTVKKKLFGR